jgi:hypothetical protein
MVMGISDNTVNNSIVGDKYAKGTSFFVSLCIVWFSTIQSEAAKHCCLAASLSQHDN